MKKIFILLIALLSTLELAAQPKFWTWSGYDKNRDWESYFEELKDVGVTGLLLSASKEGYERLIPLANQHGIEIHAWLWIMNNGTIADKHPEWLDYNQLGESIKDKKAYVDYYKFLNPIIPGVQDAIVEHIDNIASVEGLKGISLDYCRYVDAILPTSLWKNYNVVQTEVLPEWDYGYHPDMINAFIKKHGYDPLTVEDINSDELWHQFRMDKVNDIVKKLRKVAKKRGIELTASPFPTPEMSRQMVYQDWGEWKLDRAFPMIYNGFYYGDLNWIANCVRECREDMYSKAHLYMGIHVPDYKGDGDFSIFEAMDTAFENGAEGISFYTFDSLSKEQKDELKRYIKSKR
ncbi:MAG: family 10 glycosylhydrolase [Rikenellaceae bacterium]